jgi:hypothetical protein
MPSSRSPLSALALALVAGACTTPGSRPSAAYSALLSDPALAASIVWEGPSGPVAYPAWDAGQKRGLARALELVDAGLPAGLKAPPEPILPLKLRDDVLDRAKLGAEESQETCEDDGHVFYSADEAWTLYLAHVAHSLWLERGRKVAWSLRDMTPEERALLLDSRRLQKRKDAHEFEATRFAMGHALSWDPALAYRFLEGKGMLGTTPEETVFALTSWASRNLRHIAGAETFQALYAYPGPPPVDMIIRPAVPGPKKVGGCWGVTGVYAAVLRGANVPVVNSQVDGHSRPHFPTAGRFLNHGDDVYTSLIAPSGNEVPPAELLLTANDWEALVVTPAVDCVEGRCNTLKEQADYNVGRRERLLARKHMTDGFLYKLVKEGPVAVDAELRGYETNNELVTFAKPFLSDEERRAFLAELEAELARLGGGDAEKGKAVVEQRVKAFWGL